MSRKDPRARLLVPLTTLQMAHVRAQAGTQSLGDAVRRIVHMADLSQTPTEVVLEDAVRQIPVQLPRDLRLAVEELARAADCRPENLVGWLVERHRVQTGGSPPRQ